MPKDSLRTNTWALAAGKNRIVCFLFSVILCFWRGVWIKKSRWKTAADRGHQLGWWKHMETVLCCMVQAMVSARNDFFRLCCKRSSCSSWFWLVPSIRTMALSSVQRTQTMPNYRRHHKTSLDITAGCGNDRAHLHWFIAIWANWEMTNNSDFRNWNV